jgi:PAS domain S-box-containing protein
VLATAAVIGVRLVLTLRSGQSANFPPFIIAVIAAAWVGGLRPGLIATLFGALAHVFLFGPLGPGIEGASAASVISLVTVGLAVSWLASTYQVAIARLDAQSSLLKNEVSERRSAEAAAMDRERELKLVSDNAPVLIAHCTGDQVYRFVNIGYAALFGLHPREVVGRRLADVVGDEMFSVIEPNIAAVLTGRRVEFEVPLQTPEGEARLLRSAYAPEFDDKGKVVGFVAAISDVTERQRADERLREAEERFRRAADANASMVYEIDMRPGGRAVVHGFQRLTGLDPVSHPMTSEWWRSRIHPDDLPRHNREVDALLNDGTNYRLHYRLLHGSGGWIHVEEVGQVVRGPGDGVRFVGAVVDVTQRARAEEALREADRRKDEFLAILAHELRNPLAPIRNAAQVLHHVTPADSVVATARDVIDRQVDQMVRLIDDLLDISRITADKLELRRERVELREVLHHALATAQPLIEASEHELSLSLPDEPLLLDADPVRLAQILDNLLTNACKYTDRKGRICVGAARAGDCIEIRVKDNGIGIPPEHLPRLFQKFSQVQSALERSQGGLGIGLALVEGLVRMHGGSVRAQSDGPGKGTEFIVRLPALIENAVADEEPTAIPSAARRVSRRILVVDDNVDSASTLATLLELSGNQVDVAHDGLEALEAANRIKPDVVLLDLGMPRLNGYDACRRIRQEPWSTNTVVIALTGWGQEEDRRKTGEAGFNAHVVKPVTLPMLEKLWLE